MPDDPPTHTVLGRAAARVLMELFGDEVLPLTREDPHGTTCKLHEL